jgi:hypothetical protein
VDSLTLSAGILTVNGGLTTLISGTQSVGTINGSGALTIPAGAHRIMANRYGMT